jgi:uncharacterized protein YhjY with autotransporter beta-barrel domain
MSISACALASWRKAISRGCAWLFAAVVVLWSAAAAAQTFTLTLLPVNLTAGTKNSPYSQQITAVGGNGNYTYNLKPGDSLPPGLTFSSSGLLSGTPTSANNYTFTLEAVDNGGGAGNRPYTFSVGTPGGIAIHPASPLPDGTINVPYNQTLTTTGGSGTGNSFSVTGGALPAGLTLSSGGVISGTPTAGGPFSFTASVTDDAGNTGSQLYNLNIIVPIIVNPASLPNGTSGVAYNQTVTASGGTAPYGFAVTAGALPTGLSLAAGGGLTGTPTTPGTYNFTITATDANTNTGNRAYSVTINAAPLTVNPTSLPAGEVGTGYNQTVVASGGVAPYSYAVIAGALPTGLLLNAGTGAITGTPSAGGTFNFTIQATDAQPNTGQRAYSVQIGTNSLTVNPASLPNATRGTAYSQNVVASGGTGPYTYAVSAGALPAGLTLNAGTGAITGTPSGSGLSNFTIRATDSLNNFGSRAYAVNVGTSILTVNPATLPAGLIGRPYSATVVAIGGTGPYTYSVSGGALPPGLTLNGTTGVISGSFTGSGGAYAFTILALDSLGNTGSRAYSLTNRPDPAQDPDVIGLVNAQAAAARRFATAQVDNVTRHLESLHDHFNPCAFDFGISLPRPDQNTGRLYPDTNPYSPAPGNAVRSYDGTPAGQIARRMPGSQDCAENGGWADFSAWVAGSGTFGTTLPDGSVAGSKFTTAGLTGGVDWHVSDDLIVGVAMGLGSDRTNIGSDGTRSNSTSFNGALYATYKAFDPWFIDAATGYGRLDYTNRRRVADDGTLVSGDRQGSFWFGVITTSYEMKYDALRVAPYLQFDFIAAQLDGYSEQGPSAELLTYGSTHFNSVAGTVGLRGSYDVPMSWGVLTPTARLEFRRTIDGGFQQTMNYTDLGPAVSSTLMLAQTSSGLVNAALGFRARTAGGLGGELEYGTSMDGSKQQSQTIRGSLKVAF